VSDHLKPIVEALIFASPEPLTPKTLFKLLEAEPREDVEAALAALKADYEQPGGLQIVEVAGGYQIVTRAELHEWVRKLFHERTTQKLSVQALETLAVIAYKQPITAPEIADIRGVTSSGGVLSTLVERHKSQLLVPGISFARLPPDFLGTNAVPTGLRAELLASTSQLGSDTNFTRVDVRDDRRIRLTDLWEIYLRAEIGASAVGDFEELPAQYRFFAGGDQSVRGYGYQELSPVDENGNKIGGRHLFTATFEIQRNLPRNFVAAVFMDAGNAFDKFGDPLEYSAGVGLRYRLPFLSIGLDVAQSISDTSRSPRLHINFTPEF